MNKNDTGKISTDDIKILIEDLRKQRESIEKKEKILEEKLEEVKKILEKASGMTTDTAKKILLELVEKDIKADVAKKVRIYEEKIKLEAGEKAKEILLDAMRHGATAYTAEYSVSTIKVPSEEVKGRIIGREGKNIRAFEKETGVEIEIDETDEIRLSSFDAVRREIAKRSLLELIKDARIQPTRIEEVVATNKRQMDDLLLEEGKRIAEECGVFNLPTEIIKHIGSFKFRTSYGQNLALHTIEETKIGIAIAKEVGANEEIVRLGCLLHDIGKVVTNEEGTHVELGVSLLKKHGFPKEVIAAVAEHHEDKPFSSHESVIVWIADAISGSRPGARYEPHEDYVKRMNKIEEIALSFEGVDSTYAFQAGRDVRVVVNPSEVDDDGVTLLAHNIAKRLESEAEYAGQIKVTVIREVRAQQTTASK
jgi:ribonucrease Y